MGDRKVITAKGIKLTTKERSEWLLFNAKWAFFSATSMSWREQVTFQGDDDVTTVRG